MWDWRDTGTPKVAGGRDDQPAGLLRRGKYFEAVYLVTKRWYAQGSAHFNKAEMDIFKSVLELRKQHGRNG